MSISRWILPSMAMIMLIGLSGCNEEDIQEVEPVHGYVEHPIAELIPYRDRDHTSIDTSQSIDEWEDAPSQLLFLSNYLRGGEEADAQELDAFVHNARHFRVRSLGAERLIMLDMRGNRLLDYNLDTDEYTRLTDVGEGPGDIQFAKDMALDDSVIYVAEQRRLSLFDCQQAPCEYEEIVSLDFNPLSIAVANEHLAVLGQTPYLTDGPLPEADDDAEIVRLVDSEGNVESAFGAAYDSEHWIMRDFFLRDAILRYVDERELYVIAYKYLPFVYVYDHELSLVDTYEISSHVQYVAKYHEPEGYSGGVRTLDYDRTSIWDIEIVGSDFALLRVNTRINKGEVGEREHDMRDDYYVIDLAEGSSYHLGSDEYSGSVLRAFFVTDAGLVVNDAGALSFIYY